VRIRKWTIALFLLIILDSVFTIFIGEESNSFILWCMNYFGWTLNKAMLMRILYCLPLLFLVNIKDKVSMYVFFAYFMVYISGVIGMYLI